MVRPLRLGSKTIMSPVLAALIAARREPAPLSRLFRTVSMLGSVRSSSTSSRGTNDRFCGARRCIDFGRRSREVNDMANASGSGRDLQYNDKAITPGAQTERRGEAGPVRVLLGGGHAPAAFLITEPQRCRRNGYLCSFFSVSLCLCSSL